MKNKYSACKNCGFGAKTHEYYVGTCPEYAPGVDEHCVHWKPLTKYTPETVVYVASPLRGNIERNLEFCRTCCEFVIACGATPIAPHLIYTEFLDDKIEAERSLGIAMGGELLKRCDEIWVFGDMISAGMCAEIEIASRLGKPIKYHNSKGAFIDG